MKLSVPGYHDETAVEKFLKFGFMEGLLEKIK